MTTFLIKSKIEGKLHSSLCCPHCVVSIRICAIWCVRLNSFELYWEQWQQEKPFDCYILFTIYTSVCTICEYSHASYITTMQYAWREDDRGTMKFVTKYWSNLAITFLNVLFHNICLAFPPHYAFLHFLIWFRFFHNTLSIHLSAWFQCSIKLNNEVLHNTPVSHQWSDTS